MILHKEKINDVITLSAITTDKFKTSVISFSMTVPITKDDYAYNLLLSHMLRRGSKRLPSTMLINKRLDELYGSYIEIKSHRIGENISFNITAEVLDNKYIPDGLDVMGEVIKIASELIFSPAFLSPDFNTDFFEQEKKLICESIDSEINNTRVYSAKRCAELIQINTSAPSSAELRDLISSATQEGLLAHYKMLISSAPLKVFCVSANDTEELKQKIATAFEAYPCGKKIDISPIRKISRDDYVEITEKMPVSQGKLSLAFSTDAFASPDSDESYTMLMLNEILGGSTTSKLFLNIREKLGICYYCSSTYSMYSGIILISSGFEVKNYSVARKAILKQLEDIKHGKISDSELLAAQKSITNGFRQLYDSPFGLQSFYGNRELFSIYDDIDTSINKLLSVTKESIVKIASTIELKASFFIEGEVDGLREEDENDSTDI